MEHFKVLVLTISSYRLFIFQAFGFICCLSQAAVASTFTFKCFWQMPLGRPPQVSSKLIPHWSDKSMPTYIFSKNKVCTAHSGTSKLYQKWETQSLWLSLCWGVGKLSSSNTTTLFYQISASSFFFKHSSGCFKSLLRFQRSEKVDWWFCQLTNCLLERCSFGVNLLCHLLSLCTFWPWKTWKVNYAEEYPSI